MGLKLKSTGGTGSVQLNCPDNHNLDTSFTLPTTNVTGGEFVLADGSGNVNIDSGTLYVDAVNNRVGIGTASPTYLLDCKGTGAANVARFLTGSTSSSEVAQFGRSDQAVNLSIDYDGTGSMGIGTTTAHPFNLKTGAVTRATIDTSGRLGIGTTAPTTKLDIYTGSATGTYVKVENTEGRLFAGVYGTGEGYLATETSDPLILGTNGTERARLDTSGRLLINDTGVGSKAANAPLQVKSASDATCFTMKCRDTNDYAFVSFTDSDASEALSDIFVNRTAASTGSLNFATNNGGAYATTRMTIYSTGLVSIPGVYSFTTAASANVYVESSGNLSRATSSSKYKTNIETIEDVYADALLNCRPVWYRSTCANDNPDWGWWGFIAEEVAAIDPRLVHWKTVEITYDEKGSVVETPCDPEPEGVQYDRFVPHLLNLIKRQKEQIEAMEARLTALETP